jgi:hypothetical protein
MLMCTSPGYTSLLGAQKSTVIAVHSGYMQQITNLILAKQIPGVQNSQKSTNAYQHKINTDSDMGGSHVFHTHSQTQYTTQYYKRIRVTITCNNVDETKQSRVTENSVRWHECKRFASQRYLHKENIHTGSMIELIVMASKFQGHMHN